MSKNYADYLELQIEAAKDAEKLNKSKPCLRPYGDRHLSMMKFLTAKESGKKDQMMQMKTSFVTGNRPTSKKSLVDLKPITLREMMVPKIHKNSYLLCRTVTEPLTIVGTMMLIEDVNRDVEDLSLYNFFKINDDKIKLLPIGTIMIIKEPYLKYGSLGKTLCIRVDSPSDVIFLDETDRFLERTGWMKPLNDSFELTKSKANEFYKEKDYEKCIKYYNRALKMQENEIIYLNRAAVYLQTNRYYEAYNDAKRAFELGSNKEKALYRMSKASYGMRNWIKAIEHLETLLNLFPNCNDAKLELNKSKLRYEESITGNYDFISLYDESCNKNISYMDVADYTGPVEIADVKGKGKGLIASKNIKKGTLLLASKAFSYTSSVDSNNNGSLIFSLNLITNRADTSNGALNLIETVHILKCNPNRANELYSLYAGNLDRTEIIPDGVIDIGRIEQICTFNEFKTDSTFKKQEVYEKNSQKFQEPEGLWILPSYINHSCIGNAFRTFYGDFMIVYAIEDINRGDEIMFSYMDPFESIEKRRDVMENYMFICNCELCVLDRSDNFSNERNKMSKNEYDNIKSLMSTHPKRALERAVKLVDKLRKSYLNRNKYQLSLILPLGLLSTLYQLCGEYKKAALGFIEIESVSGRLVYQYVPDIFIKAAECYRQCDELEDAKRYLNKAFEMYKLHKGGDKKMFKYLYSDILKQCHLMDLI